MGPTSLGILLLPMVLLCVNRPERQLQLVFLASIFGAASAFDIGELGVVPDLVPAAAFVGLVCAQMLLGVRYPGEVLVIRTLMPLLLVALYALVTAFVLPSVFADRVQVHPQKETFGPIALAFSQGNITQSIYLIVDMAVVVCGSIFLTRQRINFTWLLNAYLVSGFLAFGFALWNLVHRLTGLWFPITFLESNPGYTIFPAQDLAGVPRISGTYTEPAALGSAMVSYFCTCLWMSIRGHDSRAAKVLLPCALLGALISTSTTSFAAFGIGAIWVLARSAIPGSQKLGRRMIIGCAILVPICVLGALSIATLAPGVGEAATRVLSETVNKSDSSSYQQRTTSDLDSLMVLIPTYGLGVGWGSNRSSSLLPGLLASLGIYGLALIPWFVWRMLAFVAQARKIVPFDSRMAVIDAMLASLFGDLITSLISAPVIGDVAFFSKLAIVIGCTGRLIVESFGTQRVREGATQSYRGQPATVQ